MCKTATSQTFFNEYTSLNVRGIRYGFRVSGNAGIMDFKDIAPLPGQNAVNRLRYNYDIGGYVEYLPEEEQFGAQGELFFGRRSGKIDFTDGYYRYSLNYLFLPLIGSYYFELPDITAYVGPQVGILLDGEFFSVLPSSTLINHTVQLNQGSPALGNYYKRVILELTGGMNYHITQDLEVDCRGSIGLLNASRNSKRPFNGFVFKTLQIGIKYNLGLGFDQRFQKLQF